MTPRTTDWTLGFLVAVLFTTGLLSMVSGGPGDAWVFVLHGAGGAALAVVGGWKLVRVWRRLIEPHRWDQKTIAGALATLLLAAALLSGLIWSNGGDLYVAGYNLLNWHILLGVLLSLAVLQHSLWRAKRWRASDLQGRRQALLMGGLAVGAFATWRAQRPLATTLGWRGAERRWTGSYEQGSFEGNAFPSTSWVADRPRPIELASYRLAVRGLVAQPFELGLAELEPVDSLQATLDCTGGFYSTQAWSGVSLGRLLDGARPLATGAHVRVISKTGYRWDFPIAEAGRLLLATHVGGEPLSHEHGAPVRLVAPDRRGFQWIKWVVRVEVHAGPDPGALASTLWSSWTRAGRGES